MEISTEQMNAISHAISKLSRIARTIARAPVLEQPVVLVIDADARAAALEAVQASTSALVAMLEIMSGHVPPEIEAATARALEAMQKGKKKPG